MNASQIGVFEIFKVGIGPSSSHTIGPLRAAEQVAAVARCIIDRVPAGTSLQLGIELFGSLAATGRGHRTHEAICAGLLGLNPATDPVEAIWHALSEVTTRGGLACGNGFVAFLPERDLYWLIAPPGDLVLSHPNTMRFTLRAEQRVLLRVTARSVGGGFVEYDAPIGEQADCWKQCSANLMSLNGTPAGGAHLTADPLYTFDSASELVALCESKGVSVADTALANERARGHDEAEVRDRLEAIWQLMQSAIAAGLDAEGVLPGGLDVRRRARRLYQQSMQSRLPLERNADLRTSAYAIAVAEQNACGGRIVTAPTNGAAGVLPAVLREVIEERGLDAHAVQDGLLVAGVIGALVKRGASISGAEVGCQGEIGTASAMAAAAATAMLGGTVRQIEDAAEIAIEHHLGMTCDPVRGLVQIPCIERNAMGAIKALNAAAMALASDGHHMVSLDRALRVMKQTGMDLKAGYRETATGGLAIG